MRISDWSSDVCSSDRNASVYPIRDVDFLLVRKASQEVPVYAHSKKDILTYQETEHFIELKGLYRVVLDLEEHDAFGDLNNGVLAFQFPAEELQGLKFQLLFPVWNETDHVFFQEARSEEHTSELQSLMRISYAVFCLKKKKK